MKKRKYFCDLHLYLEVKENYLFRQLQPNKGSPRRGVSMAAVDCWLAGYYRQCIIEDGEIL